MNDVKVFKDPIHGTIKLHPLLVKIIDTPQFQRLRNIKQMGGKYFVYPGASHNRFEHSIGVSYLAGEFLKTLQSKQESLQISEQDVLCVQIAGLCHDIGHGPFSHVFDSKVAPRLGVKNWKHEDASVLMFEYLLRQSEVVREECRRYELKVCEDDNTDLVFIKELILGCPVGMQHDEAADPTTYEFKGRTKEKWFLFEIVSNKFTSIDVDKWDNTARDCHGLGLSYDFDWKQYISLCRVLEDEELGRKTICSRDKEVTSLYDMFHAREMLHRKALQLETSVGVELLLADALVESCTLLKNEIEMDVKQALLPATDPQCGDVDLAMSIYEQLNDTIIQTALLLERRPGKQVTRISAIWRRLQHRQLYKMVGSMSEMKMGQKMAKKEKEELKDYVVKNGQDLKWPRDFEVFVAKFDYGMKDRDPLNLLKVHRNTEEAEKLTKEEKSIMLPRMFEERHIRLYCKRTDQEKIMEKLFNEWKDNTASPNSPSSNPQDRFFPPPPSPLGGGGGEGERERQTREVSEEETNSSPQPSNLQLV